jgi:hypothetical protein
MPQHTGTMQILLAWLGCLIIGNIHKLVDTFHDCIKIIFPSYQTSHLSLSNMTMHLALHNGQMPKSKAIVKLGTMCPMRECGRPGTTTLQVCVDLTLRPSGRLTVIRWVAGLLLASGTPSFTKTDVAPVSAMPSTSLISIGWMHGAK